MLARFLRTKLLGLTAAAALSAGGASAGTVVVNADEWALSNTGFAQAPDATQFVDNLVDAFGTTIHAYSTNFGYTQSSLASAMGAAGATYSTGIGFAFTAANITGFDALFLGGDYLSAGELSTLSDYVAGGGNVYISAGTGAGGAAAEAAAWNSFLSPFDIQLSAPYTGFSGTAATGGDPLFTGVSALYFNNPNGLSGGNVVCCTAEELFAVARMDTPVPPIPLPAGGLLLASALVAGVGTAWRRGRR